ncbi:flagellar hook-length control protein FliK [Pseudoalteromonas fenneropenaei]|uniref:Flagellar hook-length control protein FliK n=1 Tax=Pseudoalteromonas fenneropenaei TaxID=1737459 RepID=A0ABV7CGR5_9GAMM
MNKTPISLHNQSITVDVGSTPSQDTKVLSELSKAGEFSARNIVAQDTILQMEVELDGRWQKLRLTLNTPVEQNTQLSSAKIQVGADGKQLTISSAPQTLYVTDREAIVKLLHFLQSGETQLPKQLPAEINRNGHLVLKSLGLELALDKQTSALLRQEGRLFATLQATSSGLQVNLQNTFADVLHRSQISYGGLVKQLSQQFPQLMAKVEQWQMLVQHSRATVPALKLPVNTPQELAGLKEWQTLRVKPFNQVLSLIKPQLQFSAELKTSLNQHLPGLVKPSPVIAPATSASNHLLAYNKPLSEVSLSEIRQAVAEAIKTWVNKPFAALPQWLSTVRPSSQKDSATLAKPLTPDVLTPAAQPSASFKKPLDTKTVANMGSVPKNTEQSSQPESTSSSINKRTLSAALWLQPPLLPTAPASSTALPAALTKLAQNAPLLSLLLGIKQQLTLTIASAPSAQPERASPPATPPAKFVDSELPKPQTPSATKATAKDTVQLLTPLLTKTQTQADKPATIPPSLAQQATATFAAKTSNEIAALNTSAQTLQHSTQDTTKATDLVKGIPSWLLATTNKPQQGLSQLEQKLLEPWFKAEKSAESNPAKQLSAALNHLQQHEEAWPADLKRLINQAFSRMWDERTIQPMAVGQHLQQVFSPQAQSSPILQALDKLLVTFLAAPKALATTPNQVTPEQRLEALLNTLLPQFKASNTAQLQQALQNASLMQGLSEELGKIHQSFSQPQISQLNQQQTSEQTLLVHLFMPTKQTLPQQQTELQIGKYKKPAKAHLPEKTVWFIRLNFDLHPYGKLSAQAELMDKAVDCELLADNNTVKGMAEPHLGALRAKLAQHGLQVGEINLSENPEQVQAFYNSHAIVNIKV